MERELNELIEAWKICTNYTKSDPNAYRSAFEYVENFKQKSANVLDIGFYLTAQKEICELAHFGMQLILHAIKFKMNHFNEQTKLGLRTRLLNILLNADNNSTWFLQGPSYLKNSLCLTLIEFLKREWPQNWPNFFNELFEISARSYDQKCLVFIVLKYIAEEFLDMDNINLPTQRRKDISQYLNANMEQVYTFLIDNLDYFYTHLLKNPADNEVINLTDVCLDCFNCYINWFSFSYLFSRNFMLINIAFRFLTHEKLSVNAAKCLITLINRKGTPDERKPLIGLFEESILSQIMGCIKNSLENAAFKDLTKYLIQILIGMGFHLSALWVKPEFERPAQFRNFLNTIFEITLSQNKFFSFDAMQLWNNFLANEFMQNDADVQVCLSNLAQAMTNTFILFKNNSQTFKNEFESEEEYLKFFHKYRGELSKLIRTGAGLNLAPFLLSAYDWTMKVLNETQMLPESDQSGYDSSSMLYLSWDAVIYLWSNLTQVISKKMKQKSFKDEHELSLIKEKTIAVLSACFQSKFKNPNYCSYNLSLLSSILSFSELFDSSIRSDMYKQILDKLFDDLTFFKNECVVEQQANQQTWPANQSSFLKYKCNVRRQLAAIILNILKNYGELIKDIFDHILNKVYQMLACTYSTQMEKVILSQAIILFSNQIFSTEIQSALVIQFLNPIFEYFSSEQFNAAISSPESFVKYVGLDDRNDAESISNRKKIFYYTNLLYGILKSINVQNCLANASNSFQLDSKSNTIGFNLACFEALIALLKCFNMMHSSTLKDKINSSLLGMTDWAKAYALGVQPQQASATSTTFRNDGSSENFNEPDKAIMFFYNTYDILNQLIGLYLAKFRHELLFTPINQKSLEVAYKLGDALFTCFSDLPNFRLRSVIKYVLKACLYGIVDKGMIEKNFVVVRTNEMLLEYFLPNILARISEQNKYFAELNAKNNDENLAGSQNIESQIIEENQLTLMCRDVLDLIRTFISTTGITTSKGNESTSDLAIDEDQNYNQLEDMEGAAVKDAQNPGAIKISELAVCLLRQNKVIYQSVVIMLFDGLNWPDSYCCLRLVKIGIDLFERFPVSDRETNTEQFVLFLNAQITEQIFKWCLCALQTHGEHNEIASLIMILGYLVYDKSPLYIQEVLNANLVQIPSLNKRLFEEFLVKARMTTTKETIGSLEKYKKETFKKLLAPIVGKNVGQLYKNEIKIKNLRPLNLKPKLSADSFGANGGGGEELFNICSLFDPNS